MAKEAKEKTPKIHQPLSLFSHSLTAWQNDIRRAKSEEKLLYLANRAPRPLLEKVGRHLAVCFAKLRIGDLLDVTCFGLLVPELFISLGEFVRTNDRDARTKLFGFFKLWMDEEYRPFECESPLVKILFENLLSYFEDHCKGAAFSRAFWFQRNEWGRLNLYMN